MSDNGSNPKGISMNIIGIIVILTLPYMAGYILTKVMNMKETSQIEIYLTGFFFVFLMQGIVYFVTVMPFKGGFAQLCGTYNIAILVIIALFLIIFALDMVKRARLEKHDDTYRNPIHQDEWIIIGIMSLIAVLVLIKIIVLKDYLRTDLMLANVRTTLATETIYEYNPIISQPFTIGLIGSKKIISLPIYYAYLSKTFGINSIILLYIVLIAQTILCTYFSCITFIAPVLRNRRKTFIFACFLGGLILSGDYFSGAIGAKLCWNGYSGEAIVPCVMIPYLMYVITEWYRNIRDEEYQLTIKDIVVNTIKLCLCIIPSLFMTSITTGLLLLVITGLILFVSCIFRYRMEVRA